MHYNSQNLGFKMALKALIKSQISNKKPLGKILGDAIRNSAQNLIQIGGFIILFSVIIELLTIFNVIGLISICLTFFLSPLMLDFQLAKGIVSGFVEMTIGSKLIAESSSPLHLKVAAVSLILGWSGLSIHAQAISILATTDIRFYPFVIARLLHGIMSAAIALLVYTPTVSVMSQYDSLLNWEFSTFNILIYSCGIFILILAVLFLLSLLLSLINRIRPILHLLFH
jgi:sporulation integral membrane protein YlbJ